MQKDAPEKSYTDFSSDINIVFRTGDKRYSTCLRHFIASYATLALSEAKANTPFEIAMIADELIKNANEYSLQDTLAKIILSFNCAEVVITTINQPAPGHARNIALLQEKILQDPGGYYLSQIQLMGSGHLGLGRIVHDFSARLHCINKEDFLKVEVAIPLPK